MGCVGLSRVPERFDKGPGVQGFRVWGFRVWGFRVWGLGFAILNFWAVGVDRSAFKALGFWESRGPFFGVGFWRWWYTWASGVIGCRAFETVGFCSSFRTNPKP